MFTIEICFEVGCNANVETAPPTQVSAPYSADMFYQSRKVYLQQHRKQCWMSITTRSSLNNLGVLCKSLNTLCEGLESVWSKGAVLCLQLVAIVFNFRNYVFHRHRSNCDKWCNTGICDQTRLKYKQWRTSQRVILKEKHRCDLESVYWHHGADQFYPNGSAKHPDILAGVHDFEDRLSFWLQRNLINIRCGW